MITIEDFKGDTIWKSSSLKEVRSFVSRYNKGFIYKVEIFELKDKQGLLILSYNNGTTVKVMFLSFNEMKDIISNWRTIYGIKLICDGEETESIYKTNPILKGE